MRRTLLLTLPLVGCLEGSKDDDDDGDEDDDGESWADSATPPDGPDSGWGQADADVDADADADTDADSDLEVAVEWGDGDVTFEFNQGMTGSWSIGIAETHGDVDPWTGEDCAFGYVMPDGSLLGPYCHLIGDGDWSMTLAYGGDPWNLQQGTTVFPDVAFEPYVTYLLRDDDNGHCWAWGHDAAYYDDLGCWTL